MFIHVCCNRVDLCVCICIYIFRSVTLFSEHRRCWKMLESFFDLLQRFLCLWVLGYSGIEEGWGLPLFIYWLMDWLRSAGEVAQSSEHKMGGVKGYCRLWLFHQPSDPSWSLVTLVQPRMPLSSLVHLPCSDLCPGNVSLSWDFKLIWASSEEWIFGESSLFFFLLHLASFSSSLLLLGFFSPPLLCTSQNYRICTDERKWPARMLRKVVKQM